jgi:transposase
MPWNEVDVQEQRMRFVMRALGRKERLAALCREFGISRPTGYLWLRRYVQAGSLRALQEHSRRPRHSPRKTAEAQEQRVVALRQDTGWGAKKLQGCCWPKNRWSYRCARFIAFWNGAGWSSANSTARRRSVLSAVRLTNCGRWTAKGNTRWPTGRVMHWRFSMITAVFWWACMRCGRSTQSWPRNTCCTPSGVTGCRKPC